ncbi:MAG: hypothetical protein NZ580_03585 [Bacteroidia bacterium]|nr:hypothetical protein [Bacteroidia bacterium]MDW8235130.1 hypothetical protein [Bacteroidia bacterium]
MRRCGWWMLLSTTFGRSPFEVRVLPAAQEALIWLFFHPSEYIQREHSCSASYEIELIIRDSLRIYYRFVRDVYVESSGEEVPLTMNTLSWRVPLRSAGLKWEVLLWDKERHQSSWKEGFFSAALPPVYSVFLQGKGYSLEDFTREQVIGYVLPKGAYWAEVALYRGEQTLPELIRYLSIEERRFILQATGTWDTLRLSWRPEEFPAGRYLVGIFFYQGGRLCLEWLHPILRK